MSAIECRALRVSAGTQSGCSKSCSHDYYLRYLQQSVYRAPFYGLISAARAVGKRHTVATVRTG